MRQPVRVVAVTNLKGGSGKSTTSGLLLHAFAQLGHRVIGIDADPQGTLLRWAEGGEWSIPVLGLPTSRIHRDLPGIVSPERYDLAVIDTPPLEQQRGIVLSAMRAATDVVVTLAPTSAEWDVLPSVWDTLDEVDVLRSEPASVSVLWNRVRAGTTAARVYRQLLADSGRACLTAAIPLAERYAQAVGAPVELKPGDVAIQAAEQIAQLGRWTA
jgi:chromosome partitioning protein